MGCGTQVRFDLFSVLFLFQRETVVSTSWKSALHGDSMWSSHPISVEVQKPEEIDDIFDAISYQKVFKNIFSCGLKSFYCEIISLKKEDGHTARYPGNPGYLGYSGYPD